MKKISFTPKTRHIIGILSGLLLTMSIAFAFAPESEPESVPEPAKVTQVPDTLSTDCYDNTAEIYDECSSQVHILNTAIIKAREEDKSVLIVSGAEWCSWCHTLDHQLKGEFLSTDYEWRFADEDIKDWTLRRSLPQREIRNAYKLNKYLADNFVVAHINMEHDTIDDALKQTGMNLEDIEYLPFMYVLDKNGKKAKSADPSANVEHYPKKSSAIEEGDDHEFGSYDRAGVLKDLRRFRAVTR